MKTLVLSIIIFGVIIFVHEFGHYILAKLTGIRVEEFALGMGPKVVAKKWGETLYSLRALPLGGFCRMSGETGNEDYQAVAEYDPHRFDQKPLWARMSVIFAGPLLNFLLAVFLFTLVFTIVGVPGAVTNEIGYIVDNSPAKEAGLQPGDRIVQVDEKAVDDWSGLVEILHSSPGKALTLTVQRDGKEFEVVVTPELDPESKVGMIGIGAVEPEWKKTGLVEGLRNGCLRTYEIARLTLVGLGQMISGQISTEGVSGPIGIIQLIQESARYGIIYLVNLTALISINLGLLNLIPIPALDGSRLLFLAVEAVRGRPVNPEKENFVHLIGFVLLMLLMVIITYRDILRLFG